jgi:hypothetical protein
MRRPLSPHDGQVFQIVGSAVVQAAHNGAAWVPARTGAKVAQPEQSAQAREQDAHHGCPVIVEVRQGTSRPHTLQVEMGAVTHAAQIGPCSLRRLTRCRRPQRTHSSRLIGSLTKQNGHNGCPSASRAAGSRSEPHPEQGTA